MSDIPSPHEFLKGRGHTGSTNVSCCKAGDLPDEIRAFVDGFLQATPKPNCAGLADWLRTYYPQNTVSEDTLRRHARHVRDS